MISVDYIACRHWHTNGNKVTAAQNRKNNRINPEPWIVKCGHYV